MMDNKRIYYIDLLKAVAIIAVVLLHASYLFPTAVFNGFQVCKLGSFAWYGVPIFLMVTGSLLLNRDIDLHIFFKKRYTRLIYPFLFLAVLPAAIIMGVMFVFNIKIIDINVLLIKLWDLWYFWMLLGVYLAIPIINSFIKEYGLFGAKIFCIISIIACLFYQIISGFGVYTLIDLSFFTTPLLFIVLGWYLSNYEFKISPNKLIIIGFLIFIFCCLLTLFGYSKFFLLENSNFGLKSGVDVYILNIIEVTGLFIFIKHLACNKSIKKVLFKKYPYKLVLFLSKATYGIYIIHAFLGFAIKMVLNRFVFTGFQSLVLVFVLTIIILLGSSILVYVFSKIPYIGKYVSGYA